MGKHKRISLNLKCCQVLRTLSCCMILISAFIPFSKQFLTHIYNQERTSLLTDFYDHLSTRPYKLTTVITCSNPNKASKCYSQSPNHNFYTAESLSSNFSNKNTSLKENFHSDIELKWQKFWATNHIFKTDVHDVKKPPYYCLPMFPYPSGEGLHVGHCKGYTAADILARWKRMQGYNVLHPIGWDSFGLPTEQFAIKKNMHPKHVTSNNIENFTTQLKRMGFSYDWSREIKTSDPKFFKWTQWIFQKLYQSGLAYYTLKPVKWCEKLGTVLSNEEVIDGKSERGDYPVETRLMKQWVLRITEYADKLCDGLDNLPNWPEHIKEMQRKWIGRTTGYMIETRVFDKNDDTNLGQDISIFTSNIATLDTVNFVVIPLSSKYLHSQDTESLFNKLDKEKMFSSFINLHQNYSSTPPEAQYQTPKLMVFSTDYIAAHPTKPEQNIPIFIGLDLLEEFTCNAYYGTGEILNGSISFFNSISHSLHNAILDKSFTGTQLTPLEKNTHHNTHTIIGKLSTGSVYKLKDWIFSRQRLWGEPFPLGYSKSDPDEIILLPEGDLPLTLPVFSKQNETKNHLEHRRPPLSNYYNWTNRVINGTEIILETNIMPQWAGSSWYYLRFIDPENQFEMIRKDLTTKWLPVNVYIGGAEHAVSHLLYSRFWHKFLYDINVLSSEEPFETLINPGIILGSNMSHFIFYLSDSVYVSPHEVNFKAHSNALRKTLAALTHHPKILKETILGYHKASGLPVYAQLIKDENLNKVSFNKGVWRFTPSNNIKNSFRTLSLTEKMSKSKGNTISPNYLIKEYGADTLRLHLMFLGPLHSSSPWIEQGLVGISRFLRRVYKLCIKSSTHSQEQSQHQLYKDQIFLSNSKPSSDEMEITNKFIVKITHNLVKHEFNSAVANLMKFFNTMYKWKLGIPLDIYITFISMLHPFAPHITEEIYSILSKSNEDPTYSLAYMPWPTTFNHTTKIYKPEIRRFISILINGKQRAKLDWQERYTNQTTLIESAKNHPQIKTILISLFNTNKTLVRTIFVDKANMINFVVQ